MHEQWVVDPSDTNFFPLSKVSVGVPWMKKAAGRASSTKG